jgi:single-stranded-DNA-specific exonuclease
MLRRNPREQRWTVVEPLNAELVARLAAEINVPDSIARILVHRGIDDYDKAKAYFRPSMDLLEDPFLLDGMEVATERVLTGLRHKEKMLVFGDYDVDGTNGAAMLYLFLKEQGADITYYIPDRIREGYGISHQGIELARDNGVRLFLAIDCGITAVEQVDYANSLGLDVIICDHHETGPVLPRALAVLDPIKLDDPYPFKYLCGCGVGFKLIQGIARKLGKDSSVVPYIDFVTLASTADIVPLTGENRVLCRLGLEKINTNPRPGIKALIESAGLRLGQITAGQIVFVLAPRINAVGRLGDAMRAVRLLTSMDPAEAEEMASVLEEENRNRRKIDEDTFADAQQLAESLYDIDTCSALVIHQDHWHPGVVGIVASRMVEKYYKPAIMMATVDGVAKGSARSVSGFDIYEALKRCEDKIIQFGGHKYAAGLTVEIARLDEFRAAFDETVSQMMTEELKTPELHIDAEIALTDVTPRFVRILREFAPFGPANMRPTFLARNLEVAGTPRVVGKNHLRMKLRQNGSIFDAIGFGLGQMLPQVSGIRTAIDCVFTIEENDWVPPGGTRPAEPNTQLKIKDFRS